MHPYEHWRAVDDKLPPGSKLLDLHDDPVIRQMFLRASRAQIYQATVRDRELEEPKPEPVKKRVVPVRQRRKRAR